MVFFCCSYSRIFGVGVVDFLVHPDMSADSSHFFVAVFLRLSAFLRCFFSCFHFLTPVVFLLWGPEAGAALNCWGQSICNSGGWLATGAQKKMSMWLLVVETLAA